MGCFVRGGKNGMGCFVRGDKNCMGCFVWGGESMRDVLSGVSKNGMGCFVPGCFVLHSQQPGEQYSLIEPFILSFADFQQLFQECHQLGSRSDLKFCLA